MIDPALYEVARAEVAAREKHYPAAVASAKMTADEATLDFQAWTLIAGWLATGRFESIAAGGIDGQTIVDWALAEAAAERAVAVTTDRLAEAQAEAKDDRADRLTLRIAQLRAIARMVTRQRAQVDAINRKFREQRQQQGRKAA